MGGWVRPRRRSVTPREPPLCPCCPERLDKPLVRVRPWVEAGLPRLAVMGAERVAPQAWLVLPCGQATEVEPSFEVALGWDKSTRGWRATVEGSGRRRLPLVQA